MADKTEISWCDRTWSPWEGCQKVGPGCDHCYAEARNQRFAGGANWGPGALRRMTSDWTKPLLWNRQAARDRIQQRVFPSICDPFDNEVDPAWRARFFALIAETSHLTWLLLTKRIGNAEKMLKAPGMQKAMPPNIWLGATVVNQEEYDRDIGKLLRTPARVHFLSIEPMLGSIDMRMGGASVPDYAPHRPLPRLDWVIAGGESGPKARPMHPDWARSLRDQCTAAGVPFHFKQNGEWVGAGGQPNALPHVWMTHGGSVHEYQAAATYHPPGNHPWKHEDPESLAFLTRVGKKAAGRLLDGQVHDGFPEVQQ